MKTLVWKAQRQELQPDDLTHIMRQCLAAGVPMESATIKQRGIILNFTDEASEQHMMDAVAIGEAYDRAAVQAAQETIKQERAADLAPFKLINNLTDDNVRDVQALDKATLAQLRDILANLLAREAKILKGMARLIEHTGDGAQ